MRMTHKIHPLGPSALLGLFLHVGCAATTYNFEPGPAGPSQRFVHVGAGDVQKYIGETSPDTIRKRCGDKGLKEIKLSYGLASIVIRVFVKMHVDAMDMEYSCGATARKDKSKQRHAEEQEEHRNTEQLHTGLG